MARTRRALKRAYSLKKMAQRESVFSYVVRKQKNLCWYCGEWMGTDVTKEHIHPQKLGGTDFWPQGNIKATHSACNLVVGHLEAHVKHRLREICLHEGREVMFRLARQMRRAQAREAFVTGLPYRRN